MKRRLDKAAGATPSRGGKFGGIAEPANEGWSLEAELAKLRIEPESDAAIS